MKTNCKYCIHLFNDNKTCSAFPNGIPQDILSGKKPHDKPTKGQFDETVTFYEDNDRIISEMKL